MKHSWLEEELLPKAAGDFRIGERLYDTKLAYALNSPLNRKEITARAEKEYANVRDEMYEVSKLVYSKKNPYTQYPNDPNDSYKQTIIRAALEEAYKELPLPNGIVAIAKQQLQQAIDFVVEKNIVTMPDEPVEIIIMPEFRRGVSIAYLDAPGALDGNQPAFYAVSPLPADWTEEQVQSFLREYNIYSIQDLTIHEGVPGHYLQLALSNRYPSTLRAVLGSGPFIEAWGDEFTLRRYHDQALSYGSPPVRYVRALMLDEDIPRRGD